MALKLKIVKRIKVKNPNYSINSSLEKLQNIYRHTKWGMCVGSSEGTIQMADPAFAEQKYRTLFQNANDAIILYDYKEDGSIGSIIEANSTACRRYGYTEEEFRKMPVPQVLDEKSLEGLPAWTTELHNTGRLTAEVTHVTKDGRLIPTEVSCQTLEFNGKKIGICIARDLSFRKEALRQLCESESRFMRIIEKTYNGIALCNEDGVIVIWNSSLEKITGLEKAKAFGCYLWDVLFQFFPQAANNQHFCIKLKNLILTGLKEGKLPKDIIPKESQLIDAQGKGKFIQSASLIISTEKGNNLVLIIRDITTGKFQENEIRQQNEELRRVQKLRSRFLSNISHELRTPLTCLSTYTELLRNNLQDKVGETEKLCLKEIEHNVRRLITEVESLLELSRIENDSLTITIESMNVKEQIYLVVKDMRPIFKQMKVRLIIKIGKIPELRCDSKAFRQIITNLLNNAVKNTPPGGAVLIKALYRKGEFYCSVTDQGSGIDLNSFPDVFEKIHDAPQKDAKEAGGTSLGLVLCKELVNRLGGQIRVENNPGGGSIFSFSLSNR